MSEPTIGNIRGTQLPNPKHFGLKWKEAQKLVEEHGKLREQGKQAGREQMAVREEIRRLENEHQRQRAEAIRAGDGEPDTRAIDKARAREQKLRERIQDLRRAADMIDADLHRVVSANRAEWLRQVESRRDEAAARREAILEQLRQELRAAEGELGGYNGLMEWLQEPERGFVPGLVPVSSVA